MFGNKKKNAAEPRTSIFRRSAAAALLSAIVAPVLAAALPATASAGTAGPTVSAQISNSHLPFDLPSSSTLSAGKKVFAHYVPWYPTSYDNKVSAADYYAVNYQTLHGEKGKYKAFGGLLRDRPYTREPISDTNWRLIDMETEVKQAKSAGLDGFVVSLASFKSSNNSTTAAKVLMDAAKNVGGFTIVLRPNMIAPDFKVISVTDFAAQVALLAKHSSNYRLGDGRLVFSPFMAEERSPEWWAEFLNIMKNTYQENIAFWPMFMNEMKSGPAFSSISYGLSNWGDRNAKNNDPNNAVKTSPVSRIDAVQARGNQWLAAVALQDERPAQEVFSESLNSTLLRNTWAIAMKGGADAIHIPTWNDYAEGTQIAPAEKTGWAPLDINAYYLTWFKTGAAPKIVRDAIYVSNRTQLATAKGSSHAKQMKIMGGATVTDKAEALVFLTEPGFVTVKSGANTNTCELPAGVGSCTVDAAPGTVRAYVVRGGAKVAAVTSRYTVNTNPAVQDVNYYFTSSLRNGTSTAPAATAPVAGTPVATNPAAPVVSAPATPATGTVAVLASSDTYVNALAASRVSGDNASLVSRGDVDMDAFLRFSIPAAPAGKTLTSVKLKYWVATGAESGSTSQHKISQAADNWDEATTNYTNKPVIDSTALGTIKNATTPDTAGYASLNPEAFKAMVGSTVTLAITASSNDDLRIWSSEFVVQARQPQLELTYS